MTFSCVKTEVIKENIGYGLRVICDGEERIYRSLCYDGDRIERLSDRINALGVSACHIEDIIEDFLG